MKHPTDDELIEHHYLGEGDAGAHLKSCPGCERRFAEVRRLLENAAAAGSEDTERPDTFWARQRLTVMRRIAAQEHSPSLPARTQRWAVAAAAMVLVSSFLLYQTSSLPSPIAVGPSIPAASPTPQIAENPTADVFQDIRVTSDPWESDELKPFRDAVEWETWTESGEPAGGTL